MKPMYLVTINAKKTLYGGTADKLAAIAPTFQWDCSTPT